MVVQVTRPRVDGLKGLSDGPILAIVAVKSANVESVDNPRELCALTKGAVNMNAMREVPLGWRIECDGLTVTEPHEEVRNHRLLLL